MNTDKGFTIEPVLAVGIAVFAVAVGAYYFSDRRAAAEAVPQAFVQGGGLYGTAASTTLAGQPVEAETVSTASRNAEQPAGAVAVRACSASDLEGSAAWSGRASSLYGIAKITNRSSSACELSGRPLVEVMSGTVALRALQTSGGTAQSATLRSGEAATMSFTWSNWCGGAVSNQEVKVILPGNNGYLLIPLISSAGEPQTYVPSCTNEKNQSLISVSSFRKP